MYLFLLLLFFTASIYAQDEQDTIFRLKYKYSDVMLFGSSINIRNTDVVFTSWEDSIFIVRKPLIEYIKTPNGYILFEKVRKDSVPILGDKSLRITFLAFGQFLGKEEEFIPGISYFEKETQIFGSGSLELDFEMWQDLGFQEIIDLKLGLGVEYQLPRSGNDITGKFNFAPFFSLAKLTILKNDLISPSFIGRYGSNFFLGDLEFRNNLSLQGSKYYAVGFSITFSRSFEVRGMFSYNRGYILHDEGKITIIYKNLDAGIGYIF
jgi:hypothetical protein